MTNKNTKRALFTSLMVMVLCAAMLVGTTFAWFTDSVTSAGNKIMSGSLKVDLEVWNTEDGKFESIKNDQTPIYTYQNWEPGYTDVQFFKIENEGTLALKWKATFRTANGVTLSALADVIDVYVCTTLTEYPADRSVIDSWTHVGTVAEFVNTIEDTTNGTLAPKGQTGDYAYLGLALVMRTDAGNAYQELDLGGAFDIRILATQQIAEEDAFDALYDEDAEFDQ